MERITDATKAICVGVTGLARQVTAEELICPSVNVGRSIALRPIGRERAEPSATSIGLPQTADGARLSRVARSGRRSGSCPDQKLIEKMATKIRPITSVGAYKLNSGNRTLLVAGSTREPV